MFLGISTASWLVIGIIGVGLCLVVKLFETSPVPNDIPRALNRKSLLGRAVERFVGVNPISFIREGYQKYSKHQKPFVLPSVAEGDEVLLPKDLAKHVLFSKENEYSFKAYITGFFQLKYTSWPLAFANKYDNYVKLISKDLTETLKTDTVARSLAEEALSCLKDLWGEDSDKWVEINLYCAMEKMASRMINVLAIGPGHSDDEILLNAMAHCSDAIVFGASIIKAFPSFLHPVIGPIVGMVNRYFEVIFHKRMKPIIESKIKEQQNQTDPEAQEETLKSIDSLLDLLIRAGLRSKWPMEATSMWLSYRIFMINFPGVHTTAVSATSVLLDILSDPVDENLVNHLRAEVESIAGSSSGDWTAEDLGRAALLDSAVKESLRLNGINAASPTRKVVAPNGVILANGLFLPCGTKVGIPQYALHRDEEFYPEADRYNPYRFYTENASESERRQSSMTTPSDEYVVFGHGRRQCPGRFIFAHIFKVFIAEMLLNYDIQPILVRPKIHRWGRFQLPPVTTKLTVRRKKRNSVTCE
ncbi:cytochrome P450 [Aspergillus neoniger CBS 115656]|uniref:Cytochrome P450 n=1 Tax=Aspergillus neoniger (strain CBS 115656) TaxID=1448310 RepID=A0A318ZG57_ASPNB|nr:cytochrome P450 [Aspergillus neoniger CBS 115656]PYH35062.1 cytochrome P450 [Aspergillus neoniger CBS 115656]